MERTFVPKNRIKINIALAYLLSGTQGVEPCQRELLDNKLSSFLLQPLLRWAAMLRNSMSYTMSTGV